MQDKVCIHCFISGLVQGVWFRAGTQDQAKKLGLTGWVRNVQDGRVEAVICGDKEPVAAMQKWLQQGPPRAKVNEVSCENIEWENYPDFKIL